MNELKTLERSIKYLEDKLMIDRYYMTEDQVNELETTINDLKVIAEKFKQS